VQPLLQPDQVDAAADEEILAELVAAVHLEHQAAQVAESLLACAQERTPLPPQLAGLR
jgi:hypothetical protein